MKHEVGIANGCIYTLTDSDYNRNSLFLGGGGAGKSNMLTGQLLADLQGTTPMMLLDRGGRLAANIWAAVAAAIRNCEERGDLERAMRLRRQYKRFNYRTQNYCGISFDLTKLRTVAEDDGSMRPETAAERRDAIMSPLMRQRGEEALAFNVIGETAPHAFILIVAAHRKAHEVIRLLQVGEGAFRNDVCRDILKHGHYGEPEVQHALRFFQQLTTDRAWEDACVSTRRNFHFLQSSWQYFDEDRLDYQAFHDAGGRLICTLEKEDDVPNTLMFRMLVSLWVNCAVRRPVTPNMTPSRLVIDEAEYVDPAAILSHMENQRNKKAFIWLSMQSLDRFDKHQNRLLSIVQRIALFRPTNTKDAAEFAGRVVDAGIGKASETKVSHTRGNTRSESRQRGGSRAIGQQESTSFKGALGPSAKTVRTIGDGEEKTAIIETTPMGDLEESGHSEGDSVVDTLNWSHTITNTVIDTYTVTRERISVDEQVANSREELRRLPIYHAWDLYDDGRRALVHVYLNNQDAVNDAHATMGLDLIREQHTAYYAGSTYPVTIPLTVGIWMPDLPIKDVRPLHLKPKKEKPTPDPKKAKASDPVLTPLNDDIPASWGD